MMMEEGGREGYLASVVEISRSDDGAVTGNGTELDNKGQERNNQWKKVPAKQ